MVRFYYLTIYHSDHFLNTVDGVPTWTYDTTFWNHKSYFAIFYCFIDTCKLCRKLLLD